MNTMDAIKLSFAGLKRWLPSFRHKQGNSNFPNAFSRLSVSIYQKLLPPETIEWFPTYRCNSRCLYCGGYDNKAISGFGALVSRSEILKIVRQSGRTGTGLWNIGGRGGEPLLYPSLIEVLEEIKQCGMKGILITNGLLLNKDFISRLSHCGWDILRLSLDSCNDELNDTIRGVKGAFARIESGLKLFKEERRNSKKPVYIICCPVISSLNYKLLPGYLDFCIDNGVNEVQLMPLIDVHEGARKLMLSAQQKSELADILERRASEDRIRHNIGFILSSLRQDIKEKDYGVCGREQGKPYCIHLWKTLVISEDGYLSPCSLIKDKLEKVGPRYLDAWRNGKISELRKKIVSAEFIDPHCVECCGPLREESLGFTQYVLEKNNKR